MESISGQTRVTFRELKTRLVKVVNARVLNGDFSERGLARILGVSQPQIHNVLKGARRLRTNLADRLLTLLGMSVLDLLQAKEFAERPGYPQQSAELDSVQGTGMFASGQSAAPKKPPAPEMRRKTARVGRI
jgi:plasmid maintenance system antidote protein VapI